MNRPSMPIVADDDALLRKEPSSVQCHVAVGVMASRADSVLIGGAPEEAKPGSRYSRPKRLSRRNKLARAVWKIVWVLLYRPSPRLFHFWRRFLLRLFGARIGNGAHPYPAARIWAPWNLEMGDHSCLSEFVDCYNVDRIRIGAHATVSQYSFLCTASHDYTNPDMPLVTAPITIGERAWITADVFVAPGVTIGDGAVVTARSSVFTDIPPWVVARGNPAVPVKRREFCQPGGD